MATPPKSAKASKAPKGTTEPVEPAPAPKPEIVEGETPGEMFLRLKKAGKTPAEIEEALGKVRVPGTVEGEAATNTMDRMIKNSLDHGSSLEDATRTAERIIKLGKTGSKIIKYGDIPVQVAIGAFQMATAHDERERVEARTSTEVGIGGCAAGVGGVALIDGAIIGFTGGAGLPLAGLISAGACAYGAYEADKHLTTPLTNTMMGSTRLQDTQKSFDTLVTAASNDPELMPQVDKERQKLETMLYQATLNGDLSPENYAAIDKHIKEEVKEAKGGRGQ